MKITEYPAVTKLTTDNVFLVDGPEGTKKIAGTDLPFAIMNICGPEMHRMVFRGKNLGSTLTVDQISAIQNGTFEDLWLGDYWEINSVKWRIADFNYWRGTGDTEFTNNHLVIIPDGNLYTGKMNDTNVTSTGYKGSAMHTTGLTNAISAIDAAFPNRVLTHREYITTTVASGIATAGEWADSKVDLMNEPMVLGAYITTPASTGTAAVKRYTNSAKQLALFAVAPHFINMNAEGTRLSYWLRDVASDTAFVRVTTYGPSTETNASLEHGVRPAFAIG